MSWETHTKKKENKNNLTCLDTESQVLRKETPSPAAVFSECSKGMSQALTFRKTEFQQRLDLKFIKSLVAKSGSWTPEWGSEIVIQENCELVSSEPTCQWKNCFAFLGRKSYLCPLSRWNEDYVWPSRMTQVDKPWMGLQGLREEPHNIETARSADRRGKEVVFVGGHWIKTKIWNTKPVSSTIDTDVLFSYLLNFLFIIYTNPLPPLSPPSAPLPPLNPPPSTL